MILRHLTASQHRVLFLFDQVTYCRVIGSVKKTLKGLVNPKTLVTVVVGVVI